MQVFNTEDEQLLEKLRESQSRIQSIAMVHEKLYSSDTFSEIAIDQYINDLLDMIADSINLEKDIEVEKDMDSVPLAVGQAIPCGLLLNELITNSFKHAFKGLSKGKILISLKEDNHQITLSVRDNGIGLPEDFDIKDESSLGMTLINTLVKQLGGELQIISDEESSCFQIIFEIDK
jgi:two-component sensor histidine kinase